MNFTVRNRILKTLNSSDLIPVRICGHDEVEGKVIVLVPKFKNRLIHRLFPSTEKMFFRVKLDEQGSAVWNIICGVKNISEIAKAFDPGHEKENFTDEDNFQRVIKFLRMLYERDCISFRQIM